LREVVEGRRPAMALEAVPAPAAADPPAEPVKARSVLQHAMTEGAGVLRTAASLERTASVLAGLGEVSADPELANLVVAGRALVLAAATREETRGCHGRSDFPLLRPELAHRIAIGELVPRTRPKEPPSRDQDGERA
ncbi:MAG: hypothetical protein ACRD0N_14450, partial [Acidimicrobiales bacterium]